MRRLFKDFRYLIGWLTDDELDDELKNRRPVAVWVSERQIDRAIARLKDDPEFKHNYGVCCCHELGLPLHCCEFMMRQMFPERFGGVTG